MSTDPQALRRYLLGTASDAERDALEQAYFERDDTRAAVEDAEDALIESYLDGTLSSDERAAFDGSYLASPAHRRRVQVARSLRAAAARQRRPQAWWQYGLAAAAAMIVALAGLVWGTRDRAPSPTAQPPVAAAPALPPAEPSPAPRTPVVVALTLPPITVRGPGGPPTARIPADADVLALTLQAEPGRPTPVAPHVVVETVDGNEVWRGDATVEDGALVSIPIDRLPAGDYLARLSDASREARVEVGQYFFRVQRATPP